MENGEPGAGRTLIFVVVVTGTEAVLAVGASATAPAWGAGVIDAGRCSWFAQPISPEARQVTDNSLRAFMIGFIIISPMWDVKWCSI